MRTLIPRPLRKQLLKLPMVKSPVWWANLGSFGRRLADRLPPQSQPVVLLSMPRSGSTWVGELIGSSPDVLYLREPFTQTYLKIKRKEDPLFFEFDKDSPPAGYDDTARNVVRGFPVFDRAITRLPEQWTLRNRSRKRIVFKEVNPFMLKWLIEKFRPRIIYLLRHPAAIASSFSRLGWEMPQLEYRISEQTLRTKLPAYQKYMHSFWAEHTALQAYLTREALQVAAYCPDIRIVKFEDLCADPLTEFRDLYRFAGLEWNTAVEHHIRQKVRPEKIERHPYSTCRNSSHEATKWKTEIPREIMEQVKATWLDFDLPYYQNDW